MNTPKKALRIGRALEFALYFVGGALVLFMMVYVVGNALSRTLLRSPFPASLEIVQFLLMPALASISFMAATLARRHVVADILYGYFPSMGRKWLVFGNIVLSALTLSVLVWFTWVHALYAMERGFKAGYSDIPSWPLYFLVPFSLLVSVGIFAYQAWEQAHKPLEPEKKEDPLEMDLEPLLEQARASGEVI